MVYVSLVGNAADLTEDEPMQIRLIVPTDKAIDAVPYVRAVCRIAGGCTTTIGRGCWENDAGVLVEDRITIIDADMTPGKFTIMELRGIAADVCRRFEQDCVYLRTNADVHLVNRNGANYVQD